MKKITTILILITAIFTCASAQIIPNSSFENWTPYSGTGEYPDGWTTSDSVTIAFAGGSSVYKGTDSYGGGTYAMHLKSTSIIGIKVPGIATNGLFRLIGAGFQIFGGSADTSRSETLRGFYKYTPEDSTDAAVIKVYKLKRNGSNRDTIASGQILFEDTVDSFTSFSVPLEYRNYTDNPDTTLIIIQSSRDIGDPHVASGSELVIDSISFDGFVGINELSARVKSLNVYPSPASDKISVDLITENNISADYQIYDITGKLRHQGALKQNHESIDVSTFSEGNYLLKITDKSGRVLTTKSFPVAR